MSDNSLLDFLRSNPFWAVFIIIFMVLPIAGAVIHILLKAFGHRGIDNTPTLPEEPDEEESNKGNGGPPEEDQNKPSEPDEKK